MDDSKLPAKRAMEDDDRKPPAKKKRRVNSKVLSLFTCLDNKVLHHIFSFLEWRDLNEVACVSKKCNEVRKSDSLDQTHEATITCLPPSSRPEGRQGFQIPTNHSRMVILNFQNAQGSTVILAPQQDHVHHVTIKGQDNVEAFYDLAEQLKNIEEAHLINLNFGNVPTSLVDITQPRPWTRQWPSLSSLDCRNTTFGAIMSSWFGGFEDLKELNLDGATITASEIGGFNYSFLYDVRETLERVSCVNAEIIQIPTGETIFALARTWNLKTFVSNAPKLQWFRTDMMDGDIAGLRTKHPDIKIVSPHDKCGDKVSAGSTFDAD
ncbi:MAG: hypothetical protein SGARI_003193 [Bacillariaceae sp.]